MNEPSLTYTLKSWSIVLCANVDRGVERHSAEQGIQRCR
jgi:hypothetical protein